MSGGVLPLQPSPKVAPSTAGDTDFAGLLALVGARLEAAGISKHAAQQLGPVLADILPELLGAPDIHAAIGVMLKGEPRPAPKSDLVLDLVEQLHGETSDHGILTRLSSAITKAFAPSSIAVADPNDALAAKALSANRPVVEGHRIAVPLQAGGKPAGVIIADRTQGFSSEDVALAARLAHQASVALDDARRHRDLLQRATVDDLTQLPNRRTFRENAERVIAESHRKGEPCSLLFLDLDSFHALNKLLGHAKGNDALKAAAQCIGTHGGAGSGRYGGEEFTVVLPGVGLEAAEAIAQRIRTSIASTSTTELGHKVTASVGVALLPPGDTLNHAIDQADRAQRRAKRTGKNRVVVAFTEGHEALARKLGLPADALLFSTRLRRALGDDAGTHLLASEEFNWLLSALSLSPGPKAPGVHLPKSETELALVLSRFDAAKKGYAANPRAFGIQALILAGKLADEMHRIRELPPDERDAAASKAIELSERVNGKVGHAKVLGETVIPKAFADPVLRAHIAKRLGLDGAGLAKLEAKLTLAAKWMTFGELESALGAPKRLDPKERATFVKGNLARSAELIRELGLDREGLGVAGVIESCRYGSDRSLESELLDLLDQVAALQEARPFRGALPPEQVDVELRKSIAQNATDPELAAVILERWRSFHRA